MRVAVRAGIDEVHLDRAVGGLVGVGLGQRLERGLVTRSRGPNRRERMRATPEVTKMTRPASERRSSGSSVRISRQLAVTLMAKHAFPMLRRDVGERRQAPENGGVADQHVEPAEALIERRSERIDGLAVGEVERNERRLAARGPDRVVDLFKRFAVARKQQHMRALAREGSPPRRGRCRARRR